MLMEKLQQQSYHIIVTKNKRGQTLAMANSGSQPVGALKMIQSDAKYRNLHSLFVNSYNGAAKLTFNQLRVTEKLGHIALIIFCSKLRNFFVRENFFLNYKHYLFHIFMFLSYNSSPMASQETFCHIQGTKLIWFSVYKLQRKSFIKEKS